jgi:hypothetical protein
MSSREFSGRSAAEAAIKACEELGVSRSALKYQVVSEVGAGLEKKVVISVDADQARAAAAVSPAVDRGCEPRCHLHCDVPARKPITPGDRQCKQ